MKNICLSLIALFVCGYQFGVAAPVFEIKVQGVEGDWVESAKTIGGILPGDEEDPERLKRAQEKVKEFFDNKGFPDSKVKTELQSSNKKLRLLYQIELGSPVKILSVDFFNNDNALPSDLVLNLKKAVDLKPDELFDRDRVREMRRLVEVSLSNLNFIDSKVRDIRVEQSVSGVRLFFWVEMGQKVVLSVQGNTHFTRTELMTMIEAQKALGLGRDFVAVLLGRIQDFYQERGFRQVKITPYSFEPTENESKKVVFDIAEGPQVRIDTVTFEGNEVFLDDELETLYFAGAPDRIQSRIYNPKMVEESAATLISALKSKGYLSAKLIAIKTDEINQGKKVKIRVFITEGLQTRVQAIDIVGNTILSKEALIAELGIHEGDPLGLAKLEDGIERIKRSYRNLGRLQFQIRNENSDQLVTYSEKNQFAYLNFELEEGPLFTLGEYEIYGNESTKLHVIERELLLKKGDPLSEEKVILTEQRLRRLGIFGQVNIEFKDSPTVPYARDMKISVQEAIPGTRTIGIGFRNDLGIRAFGGVSYANLWGLNHTWALDLSANRRLFDFRFIEYTAQVSYTLPWALLGPTTLRPSLSGEKRQYIEFDAETFGFTTSLERNLVPALHLSGILSHRIERVRQFNAEDVSQNQQLTIGSITPVLRFDFRDNPLAPRRGFFAEGSYEYASSFLGSRADPVPVGYGRAQLRTDTYLNFIPGVVWYFSVRGGHLKNLANPFDDNGNLDPRVTVPLIKQFALGGVNSIRGFTEQELNVQAKDPTKRVQGFMTYVNYRTQIDFFASQNLALGPFLDAGNLQVDAFSLGNLRYGTGLGLRYLTPVGPVNFDWGFKLFPQSGESNSAFYFSLGVI